METSRQAGCSAASAKRRGWRIRPAPKWEEVVVPKREEEEVRTTNSWRHRLS